MRLIKRFNPFHVRSRTALSVRALRGSTCLALTVLCLTPTFTAPEFLPSPPSDRSLVYRLDEHNKLEPLPFEPGQTPLRPDQVAKSTKISYIELKVEHAETVFTTATPRVFLFTYQRPGSHPPFLVWLTPRKGNRRVTAIAQKGMSGYAISSDEIIKPTVRGLVKEGDLVFMEVRPRVSLMPGEYAIIGDDLARIATFRVIAGSN